MKCFQKWLLTWQKIKLWVGFRAELNVGQEHCDIGVY